MEDTQACNSYSILSLASSNLLERERDRDCVNEQASRK